MLDGLDLSKNTTTTRAPSGAKKATYVVTDLWHLLNDDFFVIYEFLIKTDDGYSGTAGVG